MADGAKVSVGGTQGEMHPDTFPKKERVLALEVRPRKFGFVIFEGPTRLLDWGVRSFIGGGKQLEAAVAKGIKPLLKLYAPSAIAIRSRRSATLSTNRALGKIMRTVRKEARSRSVDVLLLTELEIQRFFAEHHSKTKHQIASTLAGWYEELGWKLPQKRMLWQSENHNMVIFDAAATGVVFLRNGQSPQHPESK